MISILCDCDVRGLESTLLVLFPNCRLQIKQGHSQLFDKQVKNRAGGMILDVGIKNIDIMCGILGLISSDSTAESDFRSFAVSLQSLAHRGPDDEGIYCSLRANCLLGHRRLSIVDTSSAGHQPMVSEDGRFTLVFNGEIYNHVELRNDLRIKGHSFKSSTDTEVVLRGFMEWGSEFPQHLNGMFSFGVWDEATQELFLCRDRAGEKPLFTTEFQIRGRRFFAFASEIKALHQLRLRIADQHPSLNQTLVAEYLHFGNISAPQTLFDEIKKIPPATSIRILNGQVIDERKYWSLGNVHLFERLRNVSSIQIESELTDLLVRSVHERSSSNHSTGIFLSGGLDSSLITALTPYSELKSFSLSYADPNGALLPTDESAFARQVSEMFGTKHYNLVLSPSDVTTSIDDILTSQEEPNSDSVWMSVFHLSRFAKQYGAKVILTGDGADELFAGYSKWSKYRQLYGLTRHSSFLGAPLRRAASQLMKSFTSNSSARELLSRWGNGEELYYGASQVKEEQIESLIGRAGSISDRKNRGDLFALLSDFVEEPSAKESFTRRMCAIAMTTEIPDDYLTRLDRLGMAFGLEGRAPFVDHRLMEFAHAMPQHLKTQNRPKEILKRIAERRLPHEIINRKKMGFQPPMQAWLMKSLTGRTLMALETLQASQKLFAPQSFELLLRRIQNGETSTQADWTIVNFALWWEKWCGAKTLPVNSPSQVIEDCVT